MKTLFDATHIGNLTLGNRIVRSATLRTFSANKGIVTTLEQDTLVSLAAGGVGLIITGMMGVGRNSCISPEMIQIYHPMFCETYRTVVDAVHKQGGLLIAQLGHCGAKSTVLDYGNYLFAASDIELSTGQKAKALTKSEIAEIVKEFADAALRCKQTGLDGVQIHAAHGYLISQFLSPYFNHRLDEYGGPIENRARLLFDVYDAIRAEVGNSYPVLIKINSSDLIENGLTEDESTWVCQTLAQKGATAIEISGGISVNRQSKSVPSGITLQSQGSFWSAAARIAEKIDVPVISVCGYRSREFAESILNQSKICALSFSRPLIIEPDLPRRWKSGDDTPSRCVSCNKCMVSAQPGCPRSNSAS